MRDTFVCRQHLTVMIPLIFFNCLNVYIFNHFVAFVAQNHKKNTSKLISKFFLLNLLSHEVVYSCPNKLKCMQVWLNSYLFMRVG